MVEKRIYELLVVFNRTIKPLIEQLNQKQEVDGVYFSALKTELEKTLLMLLKIKTGD